MSRKLLCIIVCLTFLWLGGCGTSPVRNIDSTGRNIICFGDSLTSGAGAGPGNDYPSLLAKEIVLPVINAGVSGDTTSDALKRLTSDVLDKDPLIVIVLLGGNDYLRKIPKPETFKNLDRIVARIQEAGAMVALGDMHIGFVMREYARGCKKIARERGALLISNLMDGILDNPKYLSNHHHPNDEGYAIMTQRILGAIQPLILRNSEFGMQNLKGKKHYEPEGYPNKIRAWRGRGQMVQILAG